MKVHTTERVPTIKPQFQAVIAIIEFTPWPFQGDTVYTTIEYVDSDGDLCDSRGGNEWALEDGGDNLIAVFEDGSQAVANRYGIQTYMDQWGGVTVPWS